mgnify:CR=1|tara:strand:+ start:173 stop:385 length:213 start_codon:yes stop_codon:yes gene_type:complete
MSTSVGEKIHFGIWMWAYHESTKQWYWLALTGDMHTWPFKKQEWIQHFQTRHPGRHIVASERRPSYTPTN